MGFGNVRCAKSYEFSRVIGVSVMEIKQKEATALMWCLFFKVRLAAHVS